MNIRIVRVDMAETNKLLLRLCEAIEALNPAPPNTEVTDVIIDEQEGFMPRDESAGLDDLRKKRNEELRKSY